MNVEGQARQRRGSALTPEDAARLHMSRRGNPMTITALLTLERPIGQAELEARLQDRLARHPRFRQRVVEPRLGLGMPRWSDDSSFDVRHHVHRVDASLVPGARMLDSLVSDIATMPLGREHPLWRVHAIDGSTPALVLVVHHALADGAALLALLGELADQPSSAVPAPAPPMRGGLRDAVVGSERVPRDSQGLARARRIAAGAVAAGRLVLRHDDPKTSLRHTDLGGQKHLAFSRELELARLRDTAHVLGTTVTGLFLAAVTGALRTELREPHDEDLVIHALVPVDVRRPGSAPLGNRFGSVLFPLPVGIPDLSTRVRRVREDARALRSHASGAAGARIAAAAGAMPATVERLGVELFSRKASLVVSSVRGPEEERSFCGASIRDVVVWAPASGSIGVSVTLMSYAGRARVAIAIDGRLGHDARRLVRELELELERICSSASSPTT